MELGGTNYFEKITELDGYLGFSEWYQSHHQSKAKKYLSLSLWQQTSPLQSMCFAGYLAVLGGGIHSEFFTMRL